VNLRGVNFVQLAVFSNTVRRVYLVVPDALWGDFWRRRGLYRAFGRVPGNPSATYLHNGMGAPVIATTASSLPASSEPVLAYVNPAVFDPGEVEALLAARGISADLTVILDQQDAR
jgi:hypothetical protein